MLASRAFYLKLTPMHVGAPLRNLSKLNNTPANNLNIYTIQANRQQQVALFCQLKFLNLTSQWHKMTNLFQP
ncbi:hypothetical protein [Coleofasciculus sp. G2-EDA-02]|uniref:hypothetical protein n=1 Tax=Coleofasciculus sp. G2-EDA-02 TaxID=3069529 RepID=UPI003300CC52